MFSLNKIIRPHIFTLTPYSSARDEYSGKEGTFLDANENPFGSVISGNYNRYPDPYQWAVKEKLGEVKDVRATQIFLGNGSDEAIDLVIRACCEPQKDNILILPPTYGMYKVCADVQNIAVKQVPLTTDFQVDTKKVLDTVDAHTKIIWICSPNNPSGNIIKRTSILHILDNFTTGLVVVDEAYIDFANEDSFTKLLDKYPNLVVMQTFSKAWGLAALRLGMAFASEEFIKILNKIKYPYNLNGVTQKLLYTALGKVEKKDKSKEPKEPTEEISLQNGLVKYKAKEYETAKMILEKVLENKKIKKKDKGTALQALGLIEYKNKNYEEAKIYFSRIFTEMPDSNMAPAALLNLAKCFLKLKAKPEARQTIEELVSRFPKSKEAIEAQKLK
jgi:histidinol-phosphate aminotransferase